MGWGQMVLVIELEFLEVRGCGWEFRRVVAVREEQWSMVTGVVQITVRGEDGTAQQSSWWYGCRDQDVVKSEAFEKGPVLLEASPPGVSTYIRV